MTRHLEENELAQIARLKVEGTPLRALSELHALACPVCSGKLRFFQQFYHILREEPLSQAVPGEAGADTNRNYVVPFSLLEPTGRGSIGGMGDPVLILAAKEVSGSSGRFRTVAAFSCRNPPAVIRILEDSRDHTCTAFILTDQYGLKVCVRLVVIDDKGHSAEAMTDRTGKAVIPIPAGFEWEHSRAAVTPARLGTQSRPGNHT